MNLGQKSSKKSAMNDFLLTLEIVHSLFCVMFWWFSTKLVLFCQNNTKSVKLLFINLKKLGQNVPPISYDLKPPPMFKSINDTVVDISS